MGGDATPRALFWGKHANASNYATVNPLARWWGGVAVANVTNDLDQIEDVIWGQPGTEVTVGSMKAVGVVYVINGDNRFGDGGTTDRTSRGAPGVIDHDNFVVNLPTFANNIDWQDFWMWNAIRSELEVQPTMDGDHFGAAVAGLRKLGSYNDILVANAPDFPNPCDDQEELGRVYTVFWDGDANELAPTQRNP